MAGSQDIAEDPRNADVLVWVNGRLVPRDQAVVSVFDGGFIAGDGVWEGLRLQQGTLLFLDEHLDRLFAGARAIDLDIGLDRAGLRAALDETMRANRMHDGVHLRLMVTRGVKRTPSQDPRTTTGGATVVIVAEHKVPAPGLATTGLALLTSTVRCTRPDQFDMRLNSHSRLNLITALIQAYKAGADEALMLDDAGFVASCNATNFFFVRDGVVCTSTGRTCFNGITRAKIIAICEQHGVPLRRDNFTLLDVYGAEEAFVTGTFGGVTPVRMIDGRGLGAVPGPMTARLIGLYADLLRQSVGSP
ncbi:MAG: aminotransferase class IV [Rhodospirillales bacterium 69-11]|nr:aminotransferase class IV [Rhodospirillales bacterium]MBN8926253.1 aminotransferase class IV [Rhodospirillales bacterium]OJW20196.1 MAG: aminotransferase class IV [Rhodospirillales bacterium 69-11]